MTTQARPYEFLAAPLAAARGNVTAAVTDELRRAIVTLELKPGEVIDKGAICDRLGVSRFPVSEALARLQAEGLVDIQPQRGSVVSLVRFADVGEYMLIRKALECEALRVLIGTHPGEVFELLADNMTAQRAAAEQDDRVRFHALDLEFHELLFAGMRFDKVRGIIDSARSNLDRARRLIITPRRLAFSIADHQVILDAVVAGDFPAADRAMRTHIDTVTVELFAFARERSELFADGPPPAVDDFPFG